ncbi:transmembrane protein 115 [Microcaecilia unicolor]|uniref:Transmembrane protein 115 n=1 Tax=Microcaecilia unicolor TaxID=1415580 RepID=A0A6P7YAT4_9AMPH|nr:transmembrane protein 115 [Microcaecilia unicolor]
MNRYLPVARQHFLAALASTSVVVKSLCATVLTLYFLSFGVNTAFGLGVTPGYLFPPNFWVWTLATHGVVERHFWDATLSLVTVVVAGRHLEPLWGALELLIFFTVVNISVGVLGAFSYLLTYVATFNLAYLFMVRIHGVLGFLGGVLVALKQTTGDSIVLKVPQIRMKVVPMLLLLVLAVLRIATLIECNRLASYGFGVLSSWVYLRFYQRHSRGRGDMSDHFAFATFFPEILQPVVGLVASLVHRVLVKVRICRKTVKRYDVGAPSSITISLPGTDPQDAERRRQLALKALNERLKRVEDQSWPSMEEEDEEDGGSSSNVDSPLLPEKSQNSRDNSSSRGQESSLITFHDAPSQL